MERIVDLQEPVAEIMRRLDLDPVYVKHISIDRSGQVGIDEFARDGEGNKYVDRITGKIAMNHRLVEARVA